MMACAEKDLQSIGAEVPESYSKLASIGSKGIHKGNMHRDLLALLDCQVPDGLMVNFPFRGHQPGVWQDLDQHILLPHELFAYMWHSQREAFNQFILGPPGHIEGFWKAMEGNPQLAGHPIRLEDNFHKHTIPLSLHGDGVPITGVGKSWSKSCDIYSWNSLLGGGRTDCHPK